MPGPFDHLDKLAAAQRDFESFFGPSEDTHASFSDLGCEKVIVV